MNAEQFNILVKNPTELRNAAKDELRRTLNQYPYCQSLRLLYLKKLQLDQHPDFNNELTKTAAYTSDRKALYRLIYEPQRFDKEYILHKSDIEIKETSPANTELALEEESMAAAEYTPGIETTETETTEQVEFDKHPEDSLMELENEVVKEEELELQEDFVLMAETGGASELSTDFTTLEEENEEDLVDEHESAEIDAIKTLEAEIEEHAAAPQTVEHRVETSIEEIEIRTEQHPAIIEAEKEPAIEITLKVEAPVVEAPVQATYSGQKSFIGWLKTLQGEESKVKKVTPAVKTTSVVKETETPKTFTEAPPEEWPSVKGRLRDEPEEELDIIYRQEIQSKHYDFEKLPDEIVEEIKSIDEFVNESHKQQPQPKEYKDISVSDLAKRSLEEGEEIITETMARVLAAQGRFKRAAEITQKLMLLYPEKRTYFADLLEEFNKKIN